MTCPVYATLPVVNMGKMCMYDLHQSKTNEMEFKTFSLESIDEAFEKITSLRYSQPYALSGKKMHIVSMDVPGVSHTWIVVVRQMSGHHHYRLCCSTHDWWYHMEDQTGHRRDRLCRGFQSSKRKVKAPMVYKVDIGLICWQMIVIWMAQYFIQAGWSLMHLRALH